MSDVDTIRLGERVDSEGSWTCYEKENKILTLSLNYALNTRLTLEKSNSSSSPRRIVVVVFSVAFDGDDVRFAAVTRVTEWDLIVDVADQPHGLQMRVELFDDRQGRLQEVFGDITHGDVVRQPDFIRDVFEFASSGDRGHFGG